MNTLNFDIYNLPALQPADTIVITIDETTIVYDPADSSGGAEAFSLYCYLARYVFYPNKLGYQIPVTCAYSAGVYTLTIPANINIITGIYQLQITKDLYTTNTKFKVPTAPINTNIKFEVNVASSSSVYR